MKKIFSLLAAVLMAGSMMAADPVVLTFRDYPSTSGDSNGAFTTTSLIDSLTNASGFVTCSATTKAYPGRTNMGCKLGASSATGDFTLALVTPAEFDSIVVRCASYSTSEGSLSINGGAAIDLTDEGVSNKVLRNVKYVPTGVVSSFTVGTTAKRAFVKSITFYPKEGTTTGGGGTTTETAFVASIDFSAAGYENQQAITKVDLNDTISLIFDKGDNSNAPKYYTSGTAVRCYGGNTITVSAKHANVKKVVMTFGSSDGSNEITANVGTYANGTWNGEAKDVVFTIGGTTGNRRIATIAVTYEATAAPAVEAPEFDLTAGSYYDEQTLHLTCETEGAAILYTTDGTDPVLGSASVYMAQYGIVLSAGTTTTIKAIAYNNDPENPEYSDVVEKTYTIAPVYNSFDELVNQAGAPANQKVVVNFSNVVIDSLYANKSGNINGVYVTAAGRMVEIFCYNVPAEWEVGGTISGTVKGEWKEYNGTWEVCPSSWDGITYKAAAGTVTPPADAVIEIYAGTGYSYATYDDEEWEAQVAISGDKMYIKHIFPNMQNTLWVVGTISDGQVVFAGGQAIGEQDQTLMGGEMKFTDCALYAMTNDEDFTDATFSWNAVTKTLTALDYEVVSYTAIGGGVNDAFDGTSDPSATFTLVGTGVIPTAVENVEAAKVAKTIENGQVVIIREGVRYNAVGAKL